MQFNATKTQFWTKLKGSLRLINAYLMNKVLKVADELTKYLAVALQSSKLSLRILKTTALLEKFCRHVSMTQHILVQEFYPSNLARYKTTI